MVVATLKEGAELNLETLQEFLKRRIADYKMSQLLEIVDALPMNVSGKS